MRKSERLRLLEMQQLRLEFRIEVLEATIAALVEKNGIIPPDLDAGKWYTNKLNNSK
jgi:hypothetical protein